MSRKKMSEMASLFFFTENKLVQLIPPVIGLAIKVSN